MRKSLVIAATLSALAFGSANMASAGVSAGSFGGVKAAPANELVQTVGWKKSYKKPRWYKSRVYKHRYKSRYHRRAKVWHCTYRWGKKRCYLR